MRLQPATLAQLADPGRRARWRQELGRKGMAVNAKLTAMLSSQNANLLDLKLPHERKPGQTPLERLRLFLDQVSDAQKRLSAGPDGEPAFGTCVECSVALPLQVLDETPWAARCAECEARLSGVESA